MTPEHRICWLWACVHGSNLTLFTVRLLNFGSAAISTIPVTAAHVVFCGWIRVCVNMLDFVGGKCKQYMKNTQNCLTRTIITVAVTLPNRFLAHFVSFAGLVLAVQAFAGLAIFIIVGLAATVASVPSAPSIVVPVITVLVTFPHRLGASSLDACHAAISSSLAVKTLAYLTVFDIAFSATAIASIPRASSYVVFVVTKSIAFEVGCPAPFLNDIHATIPFALVSTIQAQAFRTVAIVVVRAAAVSSVPVASRIVVLVITVLVTLPLFVHI